MLDEAQLRRMAWRDVTLLGVAWVEGGRDLVLTLQPPDGPSGPAATVALAFRWASGLRMNTAYRADAGGLPMTWDVSFLRSDLRWKVAFDFGRDGNLEVQCDEIVDTA